MPAFKEPHTSGSRMCRGILGLPPFTQAVLRNCAALFAQPKDRRFGRAEPPQ